MKIVPIILSGGSGTRLWPLSRAQYPKQYLPLIGDKTILQETILRLNGLDISEPIIVCNVEHRFLVAQQLADISVKNPTILLEPIGRNTAPAIIAAVLKVADIQANLLVLPADHLIEDINAFHQAINLACSQAQNHKLVTFGIVPTDANTDYGYIKKGTSVETAFVVEKFIEKPNQKTASQFFESGDYLWNSGMFMFAAKTLLTEAKQHCPDIVNAMKQSIACATNDLDFIRLGREDFENSPSDSIDYALMQKSNHVVVVPLNAGWNDIGSWSALYEIGEKDKNGNVIQGNALTQSTINTYINANHRMVATIGINDLIIVDTPDALLVATKNKAHEVKKIVEQLKNHNKTIANCHRKVYRPWGWYDSVEVGENFQVKRLHIKEGAKLSLQSHQQRAEHWVVVTGVASVVNGDEKYALKKGQSTYIPLGVKHSLANNTDEVLEIIEVQSGSYLGEDDIERFEDIYGRGNE